MSESKMSVRLTDDYRLVSDGLQYVLQRQVTVDPTSAPNWSQRVAEAEAKGVPLPDGTIRKEWRNAEHPFYSLSDSGLMAAIHSVKHRIAADDLAQVSLSEFADFIRAVSDEMTERVTGT